MRHILLTQAEYFRVALLIKNSSFIEQELRNCYLTPLQDRGVKEDVIAFSLEYGNGDKASNKLIKDYLGELLPILADLKTEYLLVADAAYFKVLAGKVKADPHHGYALPCVIKGFENLTVILALNYRQMIYNPELQPKLNTSLDTLTAVINGTYVPPGDGIIHKAKYPKSLGAIRTALEYLHQYPRLTCDIEGFSLRFDKAGIGTISFAWNKHEGMAFPCDYREYAMPPDGNWTHEFGYAQKNHEVRALIKKFLETYEGELVFHNASYDAKALIYALWMRDLGDTKGLLIGLETLSRHIHDTKIIAYLATNTTAGNVLGLKPLAQEFAGNWAVEVKDIRTVPLDKLLQYNLVDALSTHYVMDKYWPIMVQDQQLELYNSLMLPSLKMLIQVELTGMPLSRTKVQEVKDKLEIIRDESLATIRGSHIIKALDLLLQDSAWESDYEGRKAKAKNPDKIQPKDRVVFDGVNFNPNSGPQLQQLLYELMGLPVLDFTDTKQPATGAETIEKLINHTEIESFREILRALIQYGKVTKILSTFIPAFEEAISKDGSDIAWLFGNFVLGGTVSGRLSSNSPNLQNIPAGNTGSEDKQLYGKLIKECFVSPPNWLFAGADFQSLEDYVSALTTKDKNKLAVYEQGFDGHCLRAAYYFKDQCPEIDVTDPTSVNSIKKLYPLLRQDSKAPTFLLTYGGTYHGMMHNLGWPEEKAKAIEKGYHDLYKESDAYIQKRLHQASKDGFVEVAFGLRVRTPLLKQVLFGTKGMPYEASAEARTAGNAMGQSYGLLNNRAAVDFMQKVWASQYRYDILPVALIHDAIYIVIRNDVEIVEWANRELIKSMEWQELPEIQHPTVKLGAALDIYWPSWAKATTLPNNADKQTILSICSRKETA